MANTTCILHETISHFLDTLVGVFKRSSQLPERNDIMRDIIALLFSVLNDHEWSPQEHASVELLVNQIRDLVYDIEDAIDYSIAWSFLKQRRTPDESTATNTDVSGLPDSILKRRDEIHVKKEKLKMQILQTVELASTGGSSWRRDRTSPVVKGDGFTDDEVDLVQRLIIGDRKLAVIPIIGTGQIVSTGYRCEADEILVGIKVCQDIFIQSNFDHIAWCRPSSTIGQDGILYFSLDSGKQILDQFKGKKCLIVYEDFRCYYRAVIRKLNCIRKALPNDNGTRILVLTHSSEFLAAYVNEFSTTTRPHFVGHQKQSPQRAFQCESCSREIGKKCEEICSGLPVNISVLGSLLSEKWKSFEEGLQAGGRIETLISEISSDYNKILAVYFLWLPYNLKQCFLYLSVFPEDYEIRTTQLIQLWIAEDFIQAKDGETLEDTAEGYLQKLIDGSVIQVSKRRWDGRVKRCTIHRLSRDFCVSQAQRERFVELHGFVDSPPLVNPRRLVVNANTIEHIFANAHFFRKVRTLLCFTPTTSGISDSWGHLFANMPILRVLMVADAGKLPHEIETLLLLKYIKLDKNAHLPDTSFICNLQNLQTLDARSEFLGSAPITISNLENLRHLFFHGSTVLLSLPNLVKLVVQGDLSFLKPESLKYLRLLRSLKLVGLVNSSPVHPLPLQFPPNIVKLTLCNTRGAEDPLQMLGHLKNLQVLHLLSNSFTGTKMFVSTYDFPQLQFLKFEALEHMAELRIEFLAFPKLNVLVINDCPYFAIIHGLEHVDTLKVIYIRMPCAELRCQMEEHKEKRRCQVHIYPLSEDDEEYDD